MQETRLIPEGDIYRLTIKASDQSRNKDIKERASKFEHWIFDEVLPSIRQSGMYMSNHIVKALAPTEHPGEVANLLKAVSRLMEKQGSAPYEITENARTICDQYGIVLSPKFVKPPENQQMQLSDFLGR